MKKGNYTIKLTGGVPGMEKYPELAEHIGRWLTRYEPEQALIGEQWLWTTNVRVAALALPFDQAMALVQKPIGIRNDGKLDRPITAYQIEVEKIEKVAST